MMDDDNPDRFQPGDKGGPDGTTGNPSAPSAADIARRSQGRVKDQVERNQGSAGSGSPKAGKGGKKAKTSQKRGAAKKKAGSKRSKASLRG